MAQIRELGLDARLTAAAGAQGWDDATALQAAAIPVLRRGGNAVLHASSGAGVTGAYVLPLLDRLLQSEAGGGVRALVLTPTEDGAARVAQLLATLGTAHGVRVSAMAEGWRRQSASDVIVATPPAALDALERSALKLAELVVLVVVDLDLMHRLGGASAVETLTPLLPRDAQRVVTAAELTPAIEQYVEAHLRRALVIPSRPADAQPARAAAASPPPSTTVNYVIVPEPQKPDVLVRLLNAQAEARPVVVTRSEASARTLRELLGQRGFAVEGESVEVRVEWSQNSPATGANISYDVPFDAEMLHALHRAGGLVLVTPREVAHLRRIAGEAGVGLQAERSDPVTADALLDYRRMLRQAMHDEDTAAQLLVLDPLFQEFGAAEVAAALSALYRRRQPAAAAPKAASTGRPPEGSATAFVRLFISLGERDNIRPADLVGAITGEAGIKGEQVGKIDIRDTFSVVEIVTAVADKVIRTLNGTTLRGRAVRVDYDRKSSGPPSARRASPAGGERRPPRSDRGERSDRGDRGGPRTPRSPRPPRRD